MTLQQLFFGYNKNTFFGRINLSQTISLGFTYSIRQLVSNPILLPAITVIVVGSFLVLSLYVIIKLILHIRIIRSEYTVLEVKPLQNTQQSPYSTQELFTLLHGLASQLPFPYRVFGVAKSFSFEIVSTKCDGIRFLVRVPNEDSSLVAKNLIAYLPGVQVKEIGDYVGDFLKAKQTRMTGFTLTRHFCFPLKRQNALDKYDPIAYITGNMTKPGDREGIALQFVLTPVNKDAEPAIKRAAGLIYSNQDLVSGLTQLEKRTSIFSFQSVGFLLLHILLLPVGLLVFATTGGREGPFLKIPALDSLKKTPNVYQEELETLVKQKLDQPLFKTTIRLLVSGEDMVSIGLINRGFVSAFSAFTNSGYQSLVSRLGWLWKFFKPAMNAAYVGRIPEFQGQPILSASEIADLYHFPYAGTTDTENLVKVHNRELPAPLSIKNNANFDVVFGKNTYGNGNYPIGLTAIDRTRHVFCIGQTGSGKSTIIFHMAKDDMQKGRGVAVIDPHGDLIEDLLAVIPESRENEFVYFNPFDIKNPMIINLMEVTPGLDGDDLEQEKELVCEGIISVFRRIFSKDENVDAHRIEYILRNAIYTAFTVPDCTIFTIYDLLNNPEFQKGVTGKLEDENLKNFWKNEFGRAGNYQVVKMVSGVTSRIGRILFSPAASRILEKPKSTINFDDILNSGKILICNVSEGKLGEDTSQLLGTIIIAKIQQAVMRRARMEKSVRKPFYLFVDEFQNFATSYFTKLLSGGRKFGLNIFIAEQSTSQQEDRNVVNVTLANTGTVICFRSAGPMDNQLMLDQFAPYVTQLDIINLPQYHFYIKLSAADPEEPFSGTTLPIIVKRDQEKIDRLIEASRKNFTIKYIKPEVKTKLSVPVKSRKTVKPKNKVAKNTGLPDEDDEEN